MEVKVKIDFGNNLQPVYLTKEEIVELRDKLNELYPSKIMGYFGYDGYNSGIGVKREITGVTAETENSDATCDNENTTDLTKDVVEGRKTLKGRLLDNNIIKTEVDKEDGKQ